MNPILKRASHILLKDSTSIGDAHTEVNELHELFSEITGISGRNHKEKDISLPEGKAIAASQAAHCLLEMKRTMVFLRGIYKAIKDLQQQFPDEQLHILYAGCGPYATLLTPITTVFTDKEVKFHLLDINKHSLDAVAALYERLGIASYIAEYIHADATTFDAKGRTWHMIISETMQQALRREPQVAIMRHLIPQLHEEGIFIPSEITVSASLLNVSSEIGGFIVDGQPAVRTALGNIFTINRTKYSEQPSTTIALPEVIDDGFHLHLLTDITVYKDEALNMYDCCLNLPFAVKGLPEQLAGKSITFKYTTGGEPGFVHTCR